MLCRQYAHLHDQVESPVNFFKQMLTLAAAVNSNL